MFVPAAPPGGVGVVRGGPASPPPLDSGPSPAVPPPRSAAWLGAARGGRCPTVFLPSPARSSASFLRSISSFVLLLRFKFSPRAAGASLLVFSPLLRGGPSSLPPFSPGCCQSPQPPPSRSAPQLPPSPPTPPHQPAWLFVLPILRHPRDGAVPPPARCHPPTPPPPGEEQHFGCR